MGYEDSDLYHSLSIYGFANQPIPVKGFITLSVTLGDGEHTTTIMVEFLVVDQPSAYNVILG